MFFSPFVVPWNKLKEKFTIMYLGQALFANDESMQIMRKASVFACPCSLLTQSKVNLSSWLTDISTPVLKEKRFAIDLMIAGASA